MQLLRSPKPIDYILAIPVYFIAYYIINFIIKPIVGCRFTDRYMGTGSGGAFHKDTLKEAMKQLVIAIIIIFILIWLFFLWARTH